MIIFYNKPNLLKLPYNTVKLVGLRDKKNIPVIDEETHKVKMVERNVPEFFIFKPGENIISPELWEKICEYNAEDMDHYLSMLKVFNPIKTKRIEAKNEEEIEVEIGQEEDKIDLSKLKLRDFKELIENTMEMKKLHEYFKFENSRDKPRPAIMSVIKDQKIQIANADKAIEKSKNKKTKD